MTQRRAKVILPTTLTVRPDLLEAFADLGVPANAFDQIVAREQAKGTTQTEFDAGLEEQAEKGRAAKKANEEAAALAEAEHVAAERKANRTALAGMALQGILAGPLAGDTDLTFRGLARLAVSYADALLDGLDKPVEAED